MKKIICLAAALLLLALALTGCHKHVSAAPATCTEPEICTECGKVMTEALGHDPGPEATCAAPQTCRRCGIELSPQLPHTSAGPATCTEAEVCAVCGAVISPALGHTVGEDGVCTTCGQQVVPAGQRYIAPGKGSAVSSDNASAVTAETASDGHYHNNIAAYYANAVLVCGDYGVEYFDPDPTGSSAYAETVNKFAAKYPNIHVTCLLTPKCCAYHSPADYDDPHDNIASFIKSTYGMMDSSVTTVDCMGLMDQHAGEYMFYRTDHHWTSLGAYYASAAYCQANGLTPWTLDSYDTVVRTGYTGSLYMYGNHPAELTANPDYSVARFPHVGYSMVYYRDGVQYNGQAVNGSVSDYAGMFLCGDQPLTVITHRQQERQNPAGIQGVLRQRLRPLYDRLLRADRGGGYPGGCGQRQRHYLPVRRHRRPHYQQLSGCHQPAEQSGEPGAFINPAQKNGHPFGWPFFMQL